MTTFIARRTSGALFTGAVVAVAQNLSIRISIVFRALKHRREATALAGFDERMLADIGLTRSDLRDAYAVPLWESPTALLRSRANDRRRYRGGRIFGIEGAEIVSPPLMPEIGLADTPTGQTIRLSRPSPTR